MGIASGHIFYVINIKYVVMLDPACGEKYKESFRFGDISKNKKYIQCDKM
jgi:hypothetical protein